MINVNYNNGEIHQLLMMPDELEYVTNIINTLPNDGLFVEWGCGGSTCKWLELLTLDQKLISIEHHRDWYEKVSNAINMHFKNINQSKFEFFHIPEQYGFIHTYGDIAEEHPFGTTAYINPTDKIFDADVFFIDGIARAACLMAVLLKHRKKNPVIFLHDYVGREGAYSWAAQFCRVEVVGTTLARMYIE